MVWIKVIGSSLLIVGGSFLGMGQARKLRQRVQLITDIERAIRILCCELALNLSSVYDACNIVSSRFDGEVGDLFARCEKFSHDLPFADQWAELIKSKKLNLDIKTVEELIHLGDYFGRYDIEHQTKELNCLIDRLEEQRTIAMGEYEKNGRVYRSIGLSSGVICAILLL